MGLPFPALFVVLYLFIYFQNVLISLDGNSKKAIVGDFGLATDIPDISKEEFHLSIVGSPYWMSPECIHGRRYDQRVSYCRTMIE